MSAKAPACRVLFVVSECVPFIKTGGLADVAGVLPKVLAPHGVDVRVMIPAYPSVVRALDNKFEIFEGPTNGSAVRLLYGEADGIELIAVDAPKYFDRPGNPYLTDAGVDYPDNHLRFATLCRAAEHVARAGLGDWQPDILHLHDWQAALTAAYLKFSGVNTPCITTVHNMAFQGLVGRDQLDALNLPAAAFQPDGLEYYGMINFLKAGLVYSNHITTVSPTYARELSHAEFGMGLHGVIAARRSDLTGLLNGIDEDVWNPATDPMVPAHYSASDLGPKAINGAALEDRFRLEHNPSAPIFCVVSRLTRQKGLDLLLEILPRLLAQGGRLALLGSGDKDLEAGFTSAAAAYPGQVGVVIGYDEALSHLMQAGADAILIPSRFEPCGLTQLYGLRYGTIPVVARTGGLADTVIDANEAALAAEVATGFQFSPVTAEAFGDAVDRAITLFADRERWTAMMHRAMAHPVGWTASAEGYRALYDKLLGR